MGNGVALRLVEGGHRVVAYNRSQDKVEAIKQQGAEGATSVAELVQMLPKPRTVWLYLPSGDVTLEHASELLDLLEAGDTLIDGGNSKFLDSMALAARCNEKGISFMDVGTSGGIVGRTEGYCLMVGAAQDVYDRHAEAWKAVAQEGGCARVGQNGAGHYVKMIHNAVEYGMMQAYAEGMELLASREGEMEISLPTVTEVWQHGSIVRSFLGGLLAEAVAEESHLDSIGSSIADNGEAKWSLLEALDKAVPVPVIAASLFARYASRNKGTLAEKTINVLRNKFGGHAYK